MDAYESVSQAIRFRRELHEVAISPMEQYAEKTATAWCFIIYRVSASKRSLKTIGQVGHIMSTLYSNLCSEGRFS